MIVFSLSHCSALSYHNWYQHPKELKCEALHWTALDSPGPD